MSSSLLVVSYDLLVTMPEMVTLLPFNLGVLGENLEFEPSGNLTLCFHSLKVSLSSLDTHFCLKHHLRVDFGSRENRKPIEPGTHPVAVCFLIVRWVPLLPQLATLKGVLLWGAPPGFAEAGIMYSQRKRLRVLSLAFFSISECRACLNLA